MDIIENNNHHLRRHHHDRQKRSMCIFAAQENSQRIAVGACARARCWEGSKKFDFRQKSEIWIRQSDFVLWWQFSYDFLIWPLNIPYNHTQLLEWMQKKPIWPSFSLKQCNQNITSAQQKWDFLLLKKTLLTNIEKNLFFSISAYRVAIWCKGVTKGLCYYGY